MYRQIAQLWRADSRRTSRRASKPMVEGLEDRKLLYATLGGSWTYGSRITYSFVPDGTSVGGVSSNLFSTLNASYSTATWQAAFKKAAAIWSSYANINIAQVSDDGSALGVSGNQQGDSRFGDIRIAMIPQGGGVLAFATLPPPFNGGTNAGDMVFNSNISWKINSDYDIQTVAMHEMGHVLGLDHSAYSTAEMYASYNGIKQSLTTDDQSGIQAVYGAYPSDPVDDGSFATARNLNSYIDGNLQVALGGMSLAGSTDSDYYVVTVPNGTTGTMVVSMQSTDLSSVSPRLTVYNGSKATIGQTSLPNSFGATATYTVSNVSAGQTYYFRATAASSLGSFGAYGMLVNFGNQSQAPIPPPNTVVTQQSDQGGGTINLGEPNLPGEGHGHHGGPSGLNADGGDGLIQIGTFSAYGESLSPATPGERPWYHRIDINGTSLPRSAGPVESQGGGGHGPAAAPVLALPAAWLGDAIDQALDIWNDVDANRDWSDLVRRAGGRGAEGTDPRG